MSISGLPPFRVETCVTEKREPGMMVFNVRPGGSADNMIGTGWLLGIDQAGEVKLNIQSDEPPQDTRALPNGNILYSLTGAGRLIEITPGGELVKHWHAAGKWRDKTPPENSIEIDLDFFHHSINIFPNGNFLMLTAEARDFSNWPENDTEADAARVTASVIGDIVLEVSQDGQIVNRQHMLDILDPYRLSYGSCSGYWRSRGFDNSNDWCHSNCATYDARDDSIIVSLRTQDSIVKMDRQSGELKWILGDHKNWKAPWSKKLLNPIGDVEWQYHQHDCSVTPDGNILCFDNGNYRATPFGAKMSDADSYSRAVEFKVNEDAMTVQQVWAYGKAPDERLFACYQGGAYRLPQTGNTFITYGGTCTIDGKPSSSPGKSFAQARLIEVTPDNEVVFDMWIDDSSAETPVPLSSFRSEFIPGL